MIRELALLRIRPGSHGAFETAFDDVAPLLREADGHHGHVLSRGLDDDTLYLLEVTWRDLAAHVDGFEPSPAHARFMDALTPYLVDVGVVHVPALAAAPSRG